MNRGTHVGMKGRDCDGLTSMSENHSGHYQGREEVEKGKFINTSDSFAIPIGEERVT